MYPVLTEHDLRVEASLQVVAADPAHVLTQDVGYPACFDVFDQLLPGGALEIAAAPAVVRVVDDIVPALSCCICFEVLFLIDDGVAIPGQVIVTG